MIHTSQALDARCLDTFFELACQWVYESLLSKSHNAHLLKLGWPGVCEFGAAVAFADEPATETGATLASVVMIAVVHWSHDFFMIFNMILSH